MAKSRTRIDDLVDEHAHDLERLKDAETRRLLAAYEDSRRELRDRLAATHPDHEFTAQQLRATLAQCEDGVRRMQDRLGVVMSEGERKAGERALRDLVAVVKKAEPAFKDAGNRIEVSTLARLAESQGLALHRYSLDRYGAQVVDEIQRQLVLGVTQGQTVRQIADRIAGANASVFAGMRGRAELIARMELARAFDAGAQAAVEELAALDEPDHPDPVLKKADEYFDSRTHPFSRALHGRAVRPRQEWEVPVAAISGGSVSGVVWPRTGSVVHGFGYPAHFNDRGRQVPWRASWGPCILQPTSFRESETTLKERRGLRAVRDGKPRRLTPTEVRNLELAGLLDGQGRVTPEGQRAALREGWQGRQTHPSGKANPEARAGGPVPREPSDPRLARSWRREVETADAFARAGYRVEHTPPPDPPTPGGKPDLKVEGRKVETFSPLVDQIDSVALTIWRKAVERGQGDRFCVNLDDSTLTIGQVAEAFRRPVIDTRWQPGRNLLEPAVEVWALKGGQLVRVVG